MVPLELVVRVRMCAQGMNTPLTLYVPMLPEGVLDLPQLVLELFPESQVVLLQSHCNKGVNKSGNQFVMEQPEAAILDSSNAAALLLRQFADRSVGFNKSL